MNKITGVFILFAFILFGCGETESKIKLICDIDESKVYIDGKPKAVCYKNSTIEIDVTIGSHRIEVKKPINEDTLYYYSKIIQLENKSIITIKVKSKKAYSEAYYWNKLKRTNKLEDYIEYFNNYPYGKHVEKVKEKLKKAGYLLKAWDKTYGGEAWDGAQSIIKTKDKNYLIVGSSVSYSKGSSDAWVFKIDKNGNKIWEKTFGGKYGDEANSVIETEDGYLIAGSTSSFGDYDVWIIKIDKNGNKLWDKTFNIKDIDEPVSLLETEDGYIIAGNTQPYKGDNYDIWIMKIDKNGNKIWNKMYGGSDWDQAGSIIKTKNGFIIAANTRSYGKGGNNIWIIKIDKNGNKVWDKVIGDLGTQASYSIIEIIDGYIIAGINNFYDNSWIDAWVIKIDKNGNKIWDKTFGGKNTDIPKSITKTEDGYIIAGYTDSYSNGKDDTWIVKTDKDGNKIWDKTLGGKSWDRAKSIIKTEDGYLVLGNTRSFGNGIYDAWIIKLEPIK